MRYISEIACFNHFITVGQIPYLNKIYKYLLDGYCFVDKQHYMAKYHRVALVLSPNSNFIRYSHYGSSAVRNNVHDLSWILVKIFKCTPREFLKEYIPLKH